LTKKGMSLGAAFCGVWIWAAENLKFVEKAVWQARFYDFNVYSFGKVKEKLNYMHANPVIRRLVEHPKDWPWSSWSNYAKNGEGLIAVDFV
jgi:hypothetical protein